MNPNTYIPVLDPNGIRLMPTRYRRAELLVNKGEAEWISNDLNIKAIQLLREPSGYNTQPIVLGADPGKLFTGMGLVSAKVTLLTLHLILPFPRVKSRKSAQRILRRARRGRRVNRKVTFPLRAHRQKRFDNRKQKKLPPSILANKRMEQRCITEIFRLFPVTSVVWEVVKADVDLTSGRKKARSGKGFSPVMVGQKQMLQWLRQFTTVHKMFGYQTQAMREHLGLFKSKNKKEQSPQTHAVDGLALAASQFIRYESFQTNREHGHQWTGSIRLTSAPFRVISRPAYYRRQLHFENPVSDAPNHRKRKGGTITPFDVRCGDFVQAEKAGKVYRGWIGGYTNSEKTKNVSVYNHEWKRIGQFSPAKVQLVKRKTGLCLALDKLADVADAESAALSLPTVKTDGDSRYLEACVSMNALISIPVAVVPGMNEAEVEAEILKLAPDYIRQTVEVMQPDQMQICIEAIEDAALDPAAEVMEPESQSSAINGVSPNWKRVTPERVANAALAILLDVQGLLESGFDTNIREQELPGGLKDSVEELASLIADIKGISVEAVLEDIYPVED